MWSVGAARSNITYFEPGIGLLGWGNSRHVAHTIESQLYARAFCIEVEGTAPHFWVEVDSCFISVALWQEVYRRLREYFPTLEPAHLMLTANHTHAAPGATPIIFCITSTHRVFMWGSLSEWWRASWRVRWRPTRIAARLKSSSRSQPSRQKYLLPSTEPWKLTRRIPWPKPTAPSLPWIARHISLPSTGGTYY